MFLHLNNMIRVENRCKFKNAHNFAQHMKKNLQFCRKSMRTKWNSLPETTNPKKEAFESFQLRTRLEISTADLLGSYIRFW